MNLFKKGDQKRSRNVKSVSRSTHVIDLNLDASESLQSPPGDPVLQVQSSGKNIDFVNTMSYMAQSIHSCSINSLRIYNHPLVVEAAVRIAKHIQSHTETPTVNPAIARSEI